MFDPYKWAFVLLIGFTFLFYFLSYQMFVKIKAHPDLDFFEIITVG